MVGLPMHNFDSEDCEALTLRTAMDECGIHGLWSTVYGLRYTGTAALHQPEDTLLCTFLVSM